MMGPTTTTMGPPTATPRKPAMTPHKTPLRTPGGSKVEQTSSTPIIDFHAIESQKENVQPLAKGRSAHALSNTLTMQHKHRSALLATQRAQMEAIVTSQDNTESDDPLDAWTKYVKWCIDNYPSGQTHESGLLPLLERATRQFKDAEQYTSDPRYLRLWILYARNVECARDVYNFLLANEIGTKLASLYEELAVVLEGQRLYEDADSMYKLGIARRANPLDRIKRRYEEYKTRIVVSQHALAAQDGSVPGTSYAESLQAAMRSAGRSMLGHKDTDTRGGPAKSQAANVLRGAGVSVPSFSTPSAVTNNGRKLNVFHDDDDETGAPSSRTPGVSTAGWDDIGTVASRNQENGTTPRTAFKIGLTGAISKKPGSGLAVFRDSDDEEDDAADQDDDKITGGLGRKPQSSTETDLLRKNPFAYWSTEAKLVPDVADLLPKPESVPMRTKTTVSRSNAPATAAAAVAKQERHAAPVALLYPSFASSSIKATYKQRGWHNEIILDQLIAQQKGFPASTLEEADPWAYLDEFVGRWLPEPEPVVDQTTALFASRDVYDPDDSVANAMALNLRPNPKKKKVKRQGEHTSRMSPTLVTKATLLEVENMFNGDSDSSDSSSDESSSDDEEEAEDLIVPLQSVGRAAPRMYLPNDVPPTPTPMSRLTDENAGVKATPLRTPGLKAGLGGATPLRTPLGAKQTAATSAAAVFRDDSDDEEEGEEVAVEAVSPVRAVHGNVMATPMPTRQSAVRRWIEPMAEEEEEQDAEEEEDYEPNDPLFRPQFQPLTPITEATYEYTRFTNSRTPATASKALPRIWHQDGGESISDERSFASTEAGNRSEGWTNANKASFELTKGLTIAQRSTTEGLEASFERSLLVVEEQIPNPCSPVNAQVLQMLLSQLERPLESLDHYVDLASTASGSAKLAELQKRCKAGLVANQTTRKSMGGTVFHGTGVLSSPFMLELGVDRFEIRGKLGEGGYGAVFLAYDINSVTTPVAEQMEDDDDEEEEADRRKFIALKVESPTNRWELYILDQLTGRLPSSVVSSVISARRFYAYQDASFLVLDLGEKGTLLEVVNNASCAGVGTIVGSGPEAGGVDEVLAMFFIAELLKVILAMHRAGLVHGDLKIDNCLLRLEDASSWSNVYSRDGQDGWSSKGLRLIDFGRAIDLTLYPNQEQMFFADWEVDARDCPAMRSQQGWRFEPDWFGVASIAHCLLFGKYITLKPDNDTHRIATPFKRYWQTEIWSALFDTCLNPRGADTLDTLSTSLEAMHDWLEKNSNKGGKNLKGLLRKLEIWSIKQQST